MSTLQLTIPAQDQQSRSPRIKAREVREWLDNLPCLDMQRAAGLVNEQLRVMNRQAVAPAVRLEILGEFLQSYFRLLESVPGNVAEAAQLQSLLKRLSQNIGFGYKIVVHELVNRKAGFLEARHLPSALLGALHALGLQLLHYYAAYQRAPQALWNECLAIYRYARKIERASWQGKLPGVGTISIDESFRLTALLRLADPYRLPSGAVRALASYFRARIALTTIVAQPDAFELVLALLKTDHADNHAEAEPLYLNPASLIPQMDADIKRLQQYKSPAALELPDALPAPLLASTLQRVLRHWQSNPSRSAARENLVTRIELVSGLDAAYCILNKGRPFDPALFLSPGQDEVIDIGCRPAPERLVAPQAIEPLQCNSRDRSSGGLCVSYRGSASVKPNTGQLFALRRPAPSDTPWVLATCRWLVEPESQAGFDMGLQYMARDPEAVVIRPRDDSGSEGEYQPALRAVQKRGEQNVLTLIARGNQLQVGGEFVVYTPQGQQRGRCIELLESGHGFDRFIYRALT